MKVLDLKIDFCILEFICHLVFCYLSFAASPRWDVIKVTFESVGLTPKDTYWVFINKADHLMHKWEYVLQNRQPPPTEVWWNDWQDFNGIKLAMNREFEGRSARIYFKDVLVSKAVDENIFKIE